jgi:6-phosphogluconolactonase (cycloisomerase 2 family)/uncharacterized protein YunC (DUF1805 family)
LSVYSGTGWTGIGNTAGAAILVSDTAPTGAVTGNLWFNTTDLNTYVYYTDGINSQWVAIGVDGSSPLYTFPAGYGTAGQALTTNGTGTLSWTTFSGYTGSSGVGYTGSSGVGYTGSASTTIGYTGSASTTIGYTGSAGAGGTPGGSTTQVQYNNAGTFAGSANLTFDGTNLGVSGGLRVDRFIQSSYQPVAPRGLINQGTGILSQLTTAISGVTSPTEGVAVDPTGRFVYVVNNISSGTVSQYSINSSTGALTSITTAVAAGANPRGAVVDSTGRFVYVTNYLDDNISQYSINQSTGALTSITTAISSGGRPTAIATDPTGRFVYVANYLSASVSQYSINQTTGALTQITTAATTGANPFGIAADPTGRFVYVTSNSGNTVSQFAINPSTGALTSITTAISSGASPWGVVVDPTGRFVYTANQNSTVSQYSINTSTGALTSITTDISSSNNPRCIAVDPTGKFVYVTNFNSNTISQFSINQNTGALTAITTAITVGSVPYGVAVDPTGRFLYVANNGDNTVGQYLINNFSSGVSTIAKLTVAGVITGGTNAYNRIDSKINIDKEIYYAMQRNIEEGDGTGMTIQGGVSPTVTTSTSASIPFGKVLSSSGYYEAITDEFIPVYPGETLYGEIWAYRANGATGTAGLLYCGVAQYDSGKLPTATNLALNYFVANAVTVPTTGVWTKYSGTITLATSHTVYNGSDGGPVRYVRPYIIVNYTAGTIPTQFVGMIIRRQNLYRDSGNIAFNGGGNFGVGVTSAIAKIQSSGAAQTDAPTLGSATGAGLYVTNTDTLYGLLAGVSSNGNAWLQVQRTNAVATAYNLNLQPSGGNVGIGTTTPGYKLTVNGRISYNGAIGEGADTTVSSSSTSLQWGNSATWTTHLWYTGGTEKLRLDSSGNLTLSSGTFTTKTPSSYAAITSVTADTAPIRIPEVNIGSSASFVPAIGQTTLHNAGYRQHFVIGNYRTASSWNGGMFVGLGGNDNNPTEAFYLNFGGSITHSSGTVSITGNVTGNAGTAGGLAVATGRNNSANQIVRTDASGYIQCGYINSSNGNEGNNSSPSRVWGTNGSDDYLRSYLTSALSVSYASSAGGLSSGATITNPTITNYTETVNPITAGTSASINLASGTVVTFTISGGNATINMPTAVAGKSFILILTQDSSARTVTWTTVVWPSATAPTISTGSGKKDIFSFFSDGANWYGTTIGQNY